MAELDPLAALQAVNARLISLLESYGIDWRSRPAPVVTAPEPAPAPSRRSTTKKVAHFRRLIRGRTDVYPIAPRAVLSATSLKDIHETDFPGITRIPDGVGHRTGDNKFNHQASA